MVNGRSESGERGQTMFLVSLLGEQPLANLMPLLHLKPVQTLLVRTERTAEVAASLQRRTGQRRSDPHQGAAGFSGGGDLRSPGGVGR